RVPGKDVPKSAVCRSRHSASCLHRLERLLDPRAKVALRGRRDVTEVAPQRLERIAFLVDLGRRAEAPVTEERDRRTPALDGVLEQETGDQPRKEEEAAVYGSAEGQPDQG